ncbi:MAG: 3-phosphoserine/phosphohydroxythreonine transaminase [Anaerolineales bacterium]|nr:3-phosphoserine/phosphohydroxythreonine transaminase [Anaerolineales bacterium]
MKNAQNSNLIAALGTSKRVHNFGAGPAVLPLPVLLKAQEELLDYQGSGMSIMEMSHRSREFADLMAEIDANLRNLLAVPSEYKILLQQGGASMQFAMVPMNLRLPGESADYIVNGAWGKAAIKDAAKLGSTRTVATTEDTNFDRLPSLASADLDPKAAYLHFTSNETIHGLEFFAEPKPPNGVPLVCDMSSNILSRPIAVAKYSLIYAGAQKNAGPAGVTIVILQEDLLDRVPDDLPVMLNYKTQAAAGSMHNTPPCFAIYILGLVLRWLIDLGGLAEIGRLNERKSGLIYRAIDQSGGFYRGHAQPDSRSRMNVPFRLTTEALEKQFLDEAKGENLVGLKGHRSVGGLRASLYNALPHESVQALVDFMKEFQRRNG